MGRMELEPSSPIWGDWSTSCVAKTIRSCARAEIQARLKLPPDQYLTQPESGMARALYDVPDVPLGPERVRCRLVVVTQPASATKSPNGRTRSCVRYELILTHLAQI